MPKYRAGRGISKEPEQAPTGDVARLFTRGGGGDLAARDMRAMWELSMNETARHLDLGELPGEDDGGWEDMRLLLAELSFKRRRNHNGGWDSGGHHGPIGNA